MKERSYSNARFSMLALLEIHTCKFKKIKFIEERSLFNVKLVTLVLHEMQESRFFILFNMEI